MFKFVVFFALVAIVAAGGAWDSGLVYSAGLPASGYEYTHTIQAPDYVNHASVSAPLGGLTRTYASPLIRTLYGASVGPVAPIAYNAW